jgi:hypothetical protein
MRRLKISLIILTHSNKILLIISMLLVFTSTAFSQINKGQWLMGGNVQIEYSYIYTPYTPSDQNTNLVLKFSPNIGYFIADGFAVGLRSNILKELSTNSNYNINLSEINLTLFLRYYILPTTQKKWNIFVDGGYGLGYNNEIEYFPNATYENRNKTFIFYVSGGFVIFLSNQIALEFNLNYNNSGIIGNNLSKRDFLFGIGLQIHFGKGKTNNIFKKKSMNPISD